MHSALYRKLRQRDVSKFQIQLCISLFFMLIVFASGINRTRVYGVCVTMSALIHYFTLVTWMWMGALAVNMYQKLVIVFVHISTRYIIAVSLVCWCKFPEYHTFSSDHALPNIVADTLFYVARSFSPQWYQLFQWSFLWLLIVTLWSHILYHLLTGTWNTQ